MELSGSAKRGYHHGDLRNALAEAAAQLAREGGPDSVTVRAAARLVGVTPTAAYRHYARHEELVVEAKHQCLERMGAVLREALDALPPLEDRLHRALRALAVAGRSYIDFALAEPGQFRTCFFQGGSILEKDRAEITHLPYSLLIDVLDELVALGYLPAERRPMAEVAAWSMVHGLTLLLLDGPLRDAPAAIRDEAITRALVVIGHGLGPGEMTPELEKTIISASRPQG